MARAGYGHFMFAAVGDQEEGGQVSFVVQEEMKFDRALFASEFGSGEKREVKGYGGAVHAKKLVFEPELVLAMPRLVADGQGPVKEVLEHLPGTVA